MFSTFFKLHKWYQIAQRITSKFYKLDVEAGLKLSLCGGLVNIEGHAKYFTDTKETDDQAQLNLTYRETTVYRELTSEALKNMNYRDLLADANIKDGFTHIVIGILYGGTCTVIFKRKIFENEKKEGKWFFVSCLEKNTNRRN